MGDPFQLVLSPCTGIQSLERIAEGLNEELEAYVMRQTRQPNAHATKPKSRHLNKGKKATGKQKVVDEGFARARPGVQDLKGNWSGTVTAKGSGNKLNVDLSLKVSTTVSLSRHGFFCVFLMETFILIYDLVDCLCSSHSIAALLQLILRIT